MTKRNGFWKIRQTVFEKTKPFYLFTSFFVLGCLFIYFLGVASGHGTVDTQEKQSQNGGLL